MNTAVQRYSWDVRNRNDWMNEWMRNEEEKELALYELGNTSYYSCLWNPATKGIVHTKEYKILILQYLLNKWRKLSIQQLFPQAMFIIPCKRVIDFGVSSHSLPLNLCTGTKKMKRLSHNKSGSLGLECLVWNSGNNQ